MKLSIDYKVEEHGWATVTFSCGEKTVEYPVSYLHDSLKDLAQLAKDVKKGKTTSKAVFMDEPGETQLRVETTDEGLGFQVVAFKDWQSWGLDKEANGVVLLQGRTSPTRVLHQIYNILWKIHEEVGPEQYKELWVEHDFPMDLYRELMEST